MNDLVALAYERGTQVSKRLSRVEQKKLGQFFTPIYVAEFMALRALPQGACARVRVLDPAAGTGVLAAAAVTALVESVTPPEHIHISLYELDARLVPLLRSLAYRMQRFAKQRGVQLTFEVCSCDFLLSPVAIARKPVADVVIANPPYLKLRANDPRARAHVSAVYGQPNIYGLFMAVCADLVLPGGRWCFITPRSWTNGLYFAAVRRHIVQSLAVDAIHLFNSRSEHFTNDDVLQEAMITWATAQAKPSSEVVISSSEGSQDLSDVQLRRLPVGEIIGQGASTTIAIRTDTSHIASLSWKGRLESYGLKVCTGPVVAFRAKAFVCDSQSPRTVPLLWMQHVKRMRLSWPAQRKGEHIVANGASAWMLVPNENMVLMRRFSPKEDLRRLNATPYLRQSLPGPTLGLENHLNYIFRPGGAMSVEEIRGLAGFLNSRVADEYFRVIAGNTQVNATDLRNLPLPPIDQLAAIGKLLGEGASLEDVDQAVELVLGDRVSTEIAA